MLFKGDKLVIKRVMIHALFCITIVVLICLLAACWYMEKTWPDVTYSELMYHMKTSFSGTDSGMIISAIMQYAVPAVVAIIAVIVNLYFLKKKNRSLFRIASVVVLVCLLLSNGLKIYAFNKKTNLISDFYNVMNGKNSSDFIETIYIDPAHVSVEFPEEKRNLIYIYLESMEVTFADEVNGGAFSENFIANLTDLSEKNENFSGDDSELNGGISLPGTNWTAGAIFAQTSGLPLDLPVSEGSIENPEQYFPTIVTMGDILKDAGYTNIIEMGSTAVFGGKAAYYTKHGEYEIHDYDYALSEGSIPEDYCVGWGYEDEKLFDIAKSELKELAKSGKPFNYTMLTVDTHTPDGYVCRLCDDSFGDNQYANVIACSDRQVSDFIKWVQKQDFYDNTTIVITGDHPTMDPDFLDGISEEYQRKTYTCIINSAAKTSIKGYREYATIDLFPTILASLGVEMASDRLGCGTNLYSASPTIIEEYGVDYCYSEFSKNSPFVESLVKFKVDEDTMEAAQANSYLEVAEEPEGTRFRLIQADNMSCLNITELLLVVHDNTTGEVHEYELEREVARTGWKGVSHSDFPFYHLNNVNCEIYISVDGFKHYLFKEITSDDLGVWDVKWDFD